MIQYKNDSYLPSMELIRIHKVLLTEDGIALKKWLAWECHMKSVEAISEKNPAMTAIAVNARRNLYIDLMNTAEKGRILYESDNGNNDG
jgi:hypothetical protein